MFHSLASNAFGLLILLPPAFWVLELRACARRPRNSWGSNSELYAFQASHLPTETNPQSWEWCSSLHLSFAYNDIVSNKCQLKKSHHNKKKSHPSKWASARRKTMQGWFWSTSVDGFLFLMWSGRDCVEETVNDGNPGQSDTLVEKRHRKCAVSVEETGWNASKQAVCIWSFLSALGCACDMTSCLSHIMHEP